MKILVFGMASMVSALAMPVVAEAQAQVEAQVATITFQYSNPGLQPAIFTMLLREDGTGHYHSEPGSAVVAGGPPVLSRDALDREMMLAEPVRGQLFRVARKNGFFGKECELKKKNLAFTGTKTITYAGRDGAGSCSFNYAKDAQLESAASALQSVSETMEQGRKLELLLTHDKLGLDAAVETLAQEQAAGRALELENIAPLLRAIADSDEVLNRTRTRATALLATAPLTTAP